LLDCRASAQQTQYLQYPQCDLIVWKAIMGILARSIPGRGGVQILEVAGFPGPGLTLLDLDAALTVPDVLPPETELARLDPGSYKLRLPGGEAWVRVTTDADVFEDHAESHEFLSPGGTCFEGLATPKSEDWSASSEARAIAGWSSKAELAGRARCSWRPRKAIPGPVTGRPLGPPEQAVDSRWTETTTTMASRTRLRTAALGWSCSSWIIGSRAEALGGGPGPPDRRADPLAGRRGPWVSRRGLKDEAGAGALEGRVRRGGHAPLAPEMGR
jgi:hypothetical protein